MQRKTTSIHNRPVTYLEAGTQHTNTIVLLHGGIGAAQLNWAEVIPELATEYRVLSPDLPGFGGSKALDNLTMNRLDAWLVGFFEAVQIEQAVLVGHAFGALLARLFAVAHPSYVPALILINGGRFPGSVPAYMRVLANTPLVGKLLFQMISGGNLNQEGLGWLFEDPDLLTDSWVAEVRENKNGLAAVLRVQVRESLPKNHIPLVPTLLLWGENDTVATLEEAKILKETIGGAQLSPIAGTRHMPHIEVADVFAFQVLQFLNYLGRPASADLPGAGPLGSA